MKPIKPFLTYTQQIQHLSTNKGLIIKDVQAAEKSLEKISYYALIGGYKDLFYDRMSRTYKKGTTFDDVLVLYNFDDALRDLVFKYIRIIEQEMRSLISYHFCDAYSNIQSAYLNPANYYNTKHSKASIPKLLKILSYTANTDTEHEYIVYQRKTYGNVPLYALMKTLTLGQTSKMYSLLSPSLKSRISQHFPGVNQLELSMHLRLLTHFRNVCAHNERLFSYKDRYDIPDTVLHQKLGIPMRGQQYILGKKDLFSVVISFRYLLSNEDFIAFKKSLSALIAKTDKSSPVLSEKILLDSMGFPPNWKMITRYKK
ncbi:MAG: Abi family protein [Butyrivibrio sp.]|jgi:abortive infection bacteriophage resistance protein|nr:Abi family protein [Butyrivibrio sp.]